MSTNPKRIGERARREPRLVFTSLMHHVYDVENLRACYDALPGNRAVGIDGVTKAEYGKRLEENLADLSARLRRMGYRPQPKRRVYIPKLGSGKRRPLGISSFEDKIVELAVRKVLEPIYETVFEDSSYGYRPGRSQHMCLKELGQTIQQRRVNHIAEADIASFFDKVDHRWMVRFLQHRIGDPRIIRLVRRMLKSGILEDGLIKTPGEGTPQGSILSPLLSNIYLHYALDQWVQRKVQRQRRGEVYYFRFADDFVACFQDRGEAGAFLRRLRQRLGKFGLELAADKTRCIEFGRYARENAYRRGTKPAQFTFLGFVHYCGKTKKGHFKVKRRTSRKKLRRGLNAFGEWARWARRVLRKGEMMRQAKARIEGHLNYYAITDNQQQCGMYVYYATRLVFKWINRKSQRKAYTWPGFQDVLRHNGWPGLLRVRKDLNPCRRRRLAK